MSYKLNKPYTDKQRADFIVEHNHNNGLLIQETDTALYALEAWELLEGDTVIDNTQAYEAEQLAKAKESKTQEATDKAYSFEEKDALITVNATNLKTRASGTYHIEGNLTNNIKMSAYAQALGDTDVVPWNTKENVNVLLNKTACLTLTSLMSQLNAKLWTVDFPTYLAQIESCQTAEEVNAIEIVYENPSEVVDISMTQTDPNNTPETGENTEQQETDDPNGDNQSPDEEQDVIPSGSEESQEDPSGDTPPQDDEETSGHSEASAEETIEENNEVTDEDTTVE